MDSDLKYMWIFLTVGIFCLIAMCVLVIASQLHGLPQGGFVIATILTTMFSSGMFVAAFLSGVSYMKEQLRLEMKNIKG